MLELMLGISDYSIKPDLHVGSICKESRFLKIEALFALHQSLCCFFVTNRLHYNANSEKNAVAECGSCTFVFAGTFVVSILACFCSWRLREGSRSFFDKTMVKCLKFL
jgi:hypothetical protein